MPQQSPPERPANEQFHAPQAATAATPRWDDVEPVFRRHLSTADLSLLRRAYELAARAHEGKFRRSGEPYITHPLAVAEILAEMQLDQ